jgi:hypothetical protein
VSVNPDCSVAPVSVHGVVVFEPAAFRALFPAFTDPPYSNGMLQLYFDLATIILNNSCASIVSDGTQRERLLNLLVAHIATLQPTAAGSSIPVGVVSGASEGTVAIQYALQVSQNAQWYLMTQYGALFWQLTAPYRTMRYVAPCNPCGPAGVYAGRRG